MKRIICIVRLMFLKSEFFGFGVDIIVGNLEYFSGFVI